MARRVNNKSGERRQARAKEVRQREEETGRQTKKNATQCGGGDDVGDAVNGLQTSAMSRKCKTQKEGEEEEPARGEGGVEGERRGPD